MTVAVAMLAALLAVPGEGLAGQEMFDRLKGLVGRWRGTYTWSGARTGSGEVAVSYSLSGHGTAVVENVSMDSSDTSMTSVYHLDHGRLRMTHFCAAGNQPRLKASARQPERNAVTFELVDVTNLRTPDAGHVHAARLAFPGPDELEIEFTFKTGSAESVERLQLRRDDRASSTSLDPRPHDPTMPWVPAHTCSDESLERRGVRCVHPEDR
jgi:hypothetical protein